MDVHHALDEMDKVHLEREEMDKKRNKERAAVNPVIKHEREKMDLKMKHVDAETDKKLMLELQEMDIKVKQEHAALDQALKLDCDKMVKEIKKIRKDMDQKLQHDRQEMDSKSLPEQLRMDRMEAKMMLDRARIAPKGQFDHFTSWEPIDRWDEGHTHEHGSSQRTEQPASNSHNKALTFSNGNEYMDAECAPH
ncbi:uncharacterized protein LOC104583447 isoform X2 [Brachypodium distachyon]|uniref:uncharacterized protein LOC104583447 isoform X2 n=1 Tax=Brachypodium distachyon TaxID=15368 RepID=UPI000D0D5256|nr:uncharacterized protein LOC104583447 isoform X2 [Brachypodium distachyon]|eukprot:XP_024316772.1 uncharacterized protein LOC104583447 isoform X2 [Brachypodium distachyon]